MADYRYIEFITRHRHRHFSLADSLYSTTAMYLMKRWHYVDITFRDHGSSINFMPASNKSRSTATYVPVIFKTLALVAKSEFLY